MQVPQTEIRTTSRPSCFLCGNKGEVLYRDLNDPFRVVPGVWFYKQCPQQECRMIWLDPMPVAEDLHLAYKKYFTHSESPEQSNTAAELRGFLYNCYQAANFL